MKYKDKVAIQQMDISQLRKLLDEKAKQLQHARIALGLGNQQDVHQKQKVRREIAVIKTILQEKEFAAQVEQGAQA